MTGATRTRIPWALAGVLMLVLLLELSPDVRAADSGPHPADIQVRIDTLPADLSVTLDGTPRPTPYAFLCAQDTAHVVNATRLASLPFVRYQFAGWSDGNASLTRTFVCDVAKNFTALYRSDYRIRVDAAPAGLQLVVNGSLSDAPVDVWCAEGASLGVSAPDAQGAGGSRFLFGNWSDRMPATHTIPCDRPTNVTASYGTQYLISVFTEPSRLLVTVDGVTQSTPHTFWCDRFASHTLGVPNEQSHDGTGYRFERWIDGEPPGTRTIVCLAPMNYSAVFVPVTTPLPGEGTVGIGWTVILSLISVVVIPFVVAGAVLAARRSPPSVQVPVPLPADAARAPRPIPPSLPGFCPQCGASRESDWVYCMACGGGLKTT